MPNARLMQEGSMKIGYSSSYPYEYTYITATPFHGWRHLTSIQSLRILSMGLLLTAVINL